MEKSPIPLRPLFEVTPPSHLLGENGTNRAPTDGLQITANNDIEALSAFLAEYDKSPGTHRIYSRECERLFLWAWSECGKPVSSLTRQDFEGYLNFLADPQPADIWCGPKAPRETHRWRPFVGPLGESAVMAAVAAVNSMMTYLVDSGYLLGNPMGLIRQRRKKMRGELPSTSQPAWTVDEDAKVERFLDTEMWLAVTQAIEAMPQETERQLDEKERLRFICAFLYLLAPRAAEMEKQRMNSFREVRGHWWWYVMGKGDKRARVPVPDDMVQALVRYRKHRKLAAAPSPKDDSPLLVSVKDGSPITARRLNQILKKLFSEAADLLPADAEHKKEKLRAASAHWGRHTGVTARVDSGMDQRYVQKDARHKDARTTGLYVHEEDEKWHEEAQKLHLPWASKKEDTAKEE
jgi:site-specific recombinase XerD